jgi:histone acetyltransferase MYST1
MVGYKKKVKSGTDSGPKKVTKKEAGATANQHIEEKVVVLAPKTEPLVNIDDHPLQNGHYLVVKYRDGSNRLTKIIESTTASNPKASQYYIHYCDFNRRMDEWISAQRIVAYPSEANPLGAAREAQENAAKKLKSVDSSGNLVDQKPSDDVASPLINSPRSLLGSGSQRGGMKSRSNSIISSGGGVTAAISTVADMDHDEHEGSATLSDQPIYILSTVITACVCYCVLRGCGAGMDEESLLEHEAVTKVKNIKYVKMGRYIMECWYFSPFPKEYYPSGYTECLYFCEFTFRFFRTSEELQRYQRKPGLPRHPPGNEIYRDNEVSMFELDGAVEKIYCQNLCYFAKLFLDHKTLYWDVDPFLFYVLCTRDDRGFHPVGYFSKEK